MKFYWHVHLLTGYLLVCYVYQSYRVSFKVSLSHHLELVLLVLKNPVPFPCPFCPLTGYLAVRLLHFAFFSCLSNQLPPPPPLPLALLSTCLPCQCAVPFCLFPLPSLSILHFPFFVFFIALVSFLLS